MDFFNLPVGKRTRHQRLLYAQRLHGIDESLSYGSSKNQDQRRNRDTLFSESEDSDEVFEIEEDEINHEGVNGIGSSRNQDRKRNTEIVSAKSEDRHEVIKIEDDENTHNNGSNGAGRSTKRKLDEAIKVEISLSDESEEENGDENGVNGIGSSSNQDPKRNTEIVSAKSEDGHEVIKIEDDENTHNNGSNGAGRSTKRKLDEAINIEISSSDESEGENGEENGSGDTSTSDNKSDESSSDEYSEDGSDGEGSGDPSKSVKVKQQV